MNLNSCAAAAGKTSGIKIVLGIHSAPEEKEGAQELQDYIAKSSGFLLSIIREEEWDGNQAIVLGTPKNCDKIKEKSAVLTKDWKGLGLEGFIIKNINGSVYITANTPVGVRHGCYDFLETFLGIRWLKPVDGEYVPKTDKFVLPKVNKRSVPGVAVRGLNVLYGPKAPATDLWLKRQRMNCLKSIGGHFYGYALTTSLFDQHPEYFSLVNGKRISNGQLCTSNPEVQKLLADWAVQQAKEGVPVLYLFANDTGGWCECDTCLAQDPPEEKRVASHATRYLKSLELLAKTMQNEYPDVILIAGAYADYLSPPKGGYRPPANLRLTYTAYSQCLFHGYDDPDCPAMREIRGTLEKWHQTTGMRVGLYSYLAEQEGSFIPTEFQVLPLAPHIASELRLAAELGGSSWMSEALAEDMANLYPDLQISDQWWANKLTYYIAAKISWDPSRSEAKLSREFYDCFFGPAGKPLYQAYQLMAKNWVATEGHSMYLFPSLWAAARFMTPQLQSKLAKLDDQALSLVPKGDEKLLSRVKKEVGFSERWQKLVQQIPPKGGKAARISFEGPASELLNSDAWGKAEKLPFGYARNTWAPTYPKDFFPGQAQAAWDGKNLYLKISAPYDPQNRIPDKDQPLRKVENQSVSGDCLLEMYVNPSGDRDSYYFINYGSDNMLYSSYSPLGFVFTPQAYPGLDVYQSFDREKHLWNVLLVFPVKDSKQKIIIPGKQWVLGIKYFNKGVVSGWPDSSLHDTNASGVLTFTN